ncbi:MAG TPA: hypothetical protein PLZ57_03110 [Pseudobdellovibrionaceae bacterium]|nr:hypothetical protein [Pseudobdellovibrionaceae bacterium]
MADEPFFSLGTFLAIGSFAVSLLITLGVLYWFFSARREAPPPEDSSGSPQPPGDQQKGDAKSR